MPVESAMGTTTGSVTESKMEEFENHIIAQDMEPEDVYKKIKEIMNSNLEQILRQEGFSYKIPKRGKKYIDYRSTIGIPLLRAGKNTTRSFTNDRTRHDATMTAWTMMALSWIIHNRVTITELELYYMSNGLFDNQDAVNRILNDICCMLRCKWRSLNVVSSQKGFIVGDISMRMNNGRVVDCSEVAQIPNDARKISEIVVNGNAAEAKFILVVQKDSMFQHLHLKKFHTLQHCIIVTACGMPDFLTLEFIQLLKKKTKLPINALTDPDPSGIKILTVYARGSVETAQENFNLALPDIQWLGISTLDYEDYGLVLNSQNSVALTQTEINMLSYLLVDEHLQLSGDWKKRIGHMIDGKRKVCFEDLEFYGYEFAVKNFLPWLIGRLREAGSTSLGLNIGA